MDGEGRGNDTGRSDAVDLSVSISDLAASSFILFRRVVAKAVVAGGRLGSAKDDDPSLGGPVPGGIEVAAVPSSATQDEATWETAGAAANALMASPFASLLPLASVIVMERDDGRLVQTSR